jgi:hypothetical protein
MGKKDKGRAIANLNNAEYTFAMGGSVEKNVTERNTGISFTNAEVFKYFKMLRNYALGRIKWTSNVIPEVELRLIEWNIFHYGRCAMLRPKIIRNNIKFEVPTPKIYRCAFTDINYRTFQPITISILNQQTRKFVIDMNYNSDEFTIFTDEFLNISNPNPFQHVAWEFACKLHELDLVFNANSHKNRMPSVFNNAGIEKVSENGILGYAANKGISIAEIMRSALGRNEQFVEIPDDMVGSNGFLHEQQHVKNEMLDLIDAQKKLYESYFELLGLYTNKDKKGVYTVKDLQKEGDESGDYITDIAKNNRIICAKDASEKFNIDISIEVV